METNTNANEEQSSTHLCAFFARTGRCKFGSSCRYSHDLSQNAKVTRVLREHEESRGDKKRGFCHHFTRKGFCKFGDSCRYAHLRENDAIEGKVDDSIDSQTLFQLLVERGLTQCSTKQIRRFISLAERCLIEDKDALRSPVLETLSEQKGVEILRAIFGTPRTFVLNVSAMNQVSFIHGLIPFLNLATSSLVLTAGLQNNVNIFLQMLGHAFDWSQLHPILDELLAMEHPPTDHNASEGLTSTATVDPLAEWLDVLHPFVRFLLEMLIRFDMDFVKEIEKMIPQLHEMQKHVPVDSIPQSRKHRQFCQHYKELQCALAQKTGKLEIREDLTRKISELKRTHKKTGNTLIECYSAAPGQLRPEGPRHDNDHADIEYISLAPTEDEVLCKINPYLPPNRSYNPAPSGFVLSEKYRAGSVVHLPSGAPAAHRDLHFRLLRYNVVADIQTAVGHFIASGGLKELKKIDRRKAKVTEGKETREVTMDLYRRVKVRGVAANRAAGVFYEIEFDEPELLQKFNKKKKQQFWERTKRLAHGSLACLWWQVEGQEKPCIVFAAVSQRHQVQMAVDRPRIGLRCIPDSFNEKLVNLMLKRTSDDQISEIILLQAGPSFFAFEPILAALKKAPIPLSHLLVQPPSIKSADEGTSSDPQPKTIASEDVNKLPLYAEAGGTFDLGFLCTDKSSQHKDLLQIDATKPEDFPLEELVQSTTLDRCQAKAIKTALTKEISLVQGPPGTGKTYVGIQIVRALMTFQSASSTTTETGHFPFRAANRSCLGPILCVCYTNHALDQFLLGLLDAGVENIVRVGGNSRSDRLSSFNLRNQNKPSLGQRGFQISKEVLPEIEQKIEHYSDGLNRMRQSILRWHQVEALVSNLAPNFEQCLEDAIGYFDRIDSVASAWTEWCYLYESGYDEWLDGPGDRDLPLEQLMELDDFWVISRSEHERLYTHFSTLADEHAHFNIRRLMKRYEGKLSEYRELGTGSDLSCLRMASIVGMTTTYVAKHQKLLEGLRPRIVILEEAAEVLEAHVLSCLSSNTEQLIMIGDHLQLRPKVDNYMLQAESGSGFDLDVSLFERLTTRHQFDFVTLRQQRRMRPQFSQYTLPHSKQLRDCDHCDCCRLIRQEVYPKLQDHVSVTNYPQEIPGMAKTMFFFDHDHPERGQQDAKSRSNDFEARFAVHLAYYLLQQECFQPGDIAVITPYVGQLLTMKKQMTSISLPLRIDAKDEELLADYVDTNLEDHESDTGSDENQKTGQADSEQIKRIDVQLNNCVRLATVDNFQGEEAKIVILSLVRNSKDGHIGFVGIKNRVNVMLSRAKEGMYILGNAQSLEAYTKNTMWKNLLKTMRDQGCVGRYLETRCQVHADHKTRISHWNEFKLAVGDGGCSTPCGQQMPCGHICRRRCHVTNRDHSFPDCNVLVSVELPCGHVKSNVPCHEALESSRIPCDELVEVEVDGCRHGHKYNVRCSHAKTFRACPNNCITTVDVKMPICGHEISVKCCQEEIFLKHPDRCYMRCERVIDKCGHTCLRRCGVCISQTLKNNPDFILSPDTASQINHGVCQSICNKTLLCGHECRELCHADRDICKPCEEKCTIVCDHRKHGCNKKCCDPCASCAEPCQWNCDHRGKCTLPCGAPCQRLPCDRRCDKTLACGCRCPSLCGEKCPTQNFCRIHAPPSVQQMNVDMILFRKYSEISEEELTQDPLIVLRCGHAFLTSSLDGHMGIFEFYGRDKYDRWTKPVTGDRFLQFDIRKTCMVCREPIVCVYRYGRIINKTAVDLMERVFFQRFEDSFTQLKSRLDKVVSDLDGFRAPERQQREEKRRVRIKELRSFQHRLNAIADDYLSLVQRSDQTPSMNVYHKMRSTILGRHQAGEITEEEKVTEMRAISVPKPDATRPCRAYVGYGYCQRYWIHCQRLILETIKLSIDDWTGGKGLQLASIRKNITTGWQKIFDGHAAIDDSYRAAQSSCSNTRIIDACKGSLQIHLESLRFSMETFGFEVAKALNKSINENEENVKQMQKSIVERAEEMITIGLEACTTPQQQTDIRKLRMDVENLKKVVSEMTTAEKLSVLKTVISADPNIHISSARGHIYRCPNGHFYIIGECGGANQRGQCPDCQMPIGGEGHRLAPSNSRITDSEMHHF